MMFDLHGRVAVITGASTGLGRQYALALAGQGADIVIMARRVELLEQVAAEVQEKGVKCLPIKCDVTDLDQIKSAVTATIAEFGKVDILVNNAGGGPLAPLEETSEELWQHGLDLELTGVFRCMCEFGKEMLKAGYGRIINCSSMFGVTSTPQITITNYCAVKGGVVNLTRQAACEWATKGITVNCLCPGFFPSESNNPETMEALGDWITDRCPMHRAGVDGELDSTIIYLAADESSYVTGGVFLCDGGWTCC